LRDDVLLPGYIPNEDLPGIYNLADVFVLTSVYEGFGIPVIEAMACGCPVIASKTGALPEVGGNAAQYVDPSNPEEIAEAIKKVLVEKTSRAELVNKGLNRANDFSWEKCARETLAVIRSVASTRDKDI
jgi:glycosyltransferase involved in cell wall biosynthesis